MWKKFKAYATFSKTFYDEHGSQYQSTGNIVKPFPEKALYAPGQNSFKISAKTNRKELLRGIFEA